MPVGADLVMEEHRDGRWFLEADYYYESLIRLDDRDGVPTFTITSLRDLGLAAPTAPYLRMLLAGLSETFEWTVDERVAYLLSAPGVAPTWTAGGLRELCYGDNATRNAAR